MSCNARRRYIYPRWTPYCWSRLRDQGSAIRKNPTDEARYFTATFRGALLAPPTLRITGWLPDRTLLGI